MEVYEGKIKEYICISASEGSDPGDDDSDMDSTAFLRRLMRSSRNSPSGRNPSHGVVAL
ncbi:hypothetical protein Dsin_013477 [Dipteronia sinensis]|uniref:Uncharacterized protein n=1 Tax=Dipteronia sinensis TaxID=43782 RepID=A0AAE0AL73_9ROSI|nr:hypothetical protein Dsin_013477 [Dipteronia sinensis]